MKITVKNITALRRKLVRICNAARRKGWKLVRFDYGNPTTKTCCLRGAVQLARKADLYDHAAAPQAKFLGVTPVQVTQLEAGFEGWGRQGQDEVRKLGAEMFERFGRKS